MAVENKVRTRILKTAGSLFTLKGYELVGINEIIEKSEIARATFYNHFKSKERLCLDWLKEEKESSEENNTAILKSYTSASDCIKIKYSQLESHLKENQFRGCPFSNTKVMTPDSQDISKFIITYKNGSLGFWSAVARRANKEDLGGPLFLLYSGATSEAQNLESCSPLQIALDSSLTLISSS